MGNYKMSYFHKLIYFMISIIFKFISIIPYRFFNHIIYLFANIISFLDFRHRKVALYNLDYAYGDSIDKNRKNKIVRENYKNLLNMLFEVSWIKRGVNSKIDKNIKICGWNFLIESLSKKKGCLIVSGHIGSWEFLPYIIARLGVKLNIIYRTLDFKPLDKFVKKLRSKYGGNLIVSKKDAMSSVINSINAGESVGLLIDQSVDWYNGVWVDFFGHRTCTTTGPARIVLDCNVAVIPTFISRNSNFFEVSFLKPVFSTITNDKRKSIEINTLNYSKIIENKVKERPEDWFWLHRRWKNKPYSFLSIN